MKEIDNKIKVEIIGEALVGGEVSYHGCTNMWIHRCTPSRYRKSGIEVELRDMGGGVILCCAHEIKKLGWID